MMSPTPMRYSEVGGATGAGAAAGLGELVDEGSALSGAGGSYFGGEGTEPNELMPAGGETAGDFAPSLKALPGCAPVVAAGLREAAACCVPVLVSVLLSVLASDFDAAGSFLASPFGASFAESLPAGLASGFAGSLFLSSLAGEPLGTTAASSSTGPTRCAAASVAQAAQTAKANAATLKNFLLMHSTSLRTLPRGATGQRRPARFLRRCNLGSRGRVVSDASPHHG